MDVPNLPLMPRRNAPQERGDSLLISSPTTSGKAFAGEIAPVKGVMEKKKVVYLVDG